MKANIIKKTLIDRIIDFMSGRVGGVATLKEIYSHIQNDFTNDGESLPNNLQEKIRCVIYRNEHKLKRVTKGVYLYLGSDTAGLILHGDGRKLEEIEDNSIDSIITDHPWSDKKAHKSGNQKNFASDYENNCFRYTQEDFNQKARVLKDGGYLVEFLPTESFSNYKYLYDIKQMAEKAGFEYYAKLMWMKAPEGSINTGRTTKGIEDIMIFTKGKGRRLAADKKPYLTKFILPGRLDIPAPKPKEKKHQAEKNVSVYEFLLKATTEEGDVVLDQFGGSLNLIEASINTNRFGIVYEYLSKFICKAVNRLKAIPLFASDTDIKEIKHCDNKSTVDLDDILGSEPNIPLVVVDIADNISNNIDIEQKQVDSLADNHVSSQEIVRELSYSDSEQISLFEKGNHIIKQDAIPLKVSKFQLDMLLKLSKVKTNLFTEKDIMFINNINLSDINNREALHVLFELIYNTAYEKCYKRLTIKLSEEQEHIFIDVSNAINNVFINKLPNQYIRNYYKNYIIETEDFAKYMIKQECCKSFDEIKSKAINYIDTYLDLVCSHTIFKDKNIINVKTMILQLLV